LVLLRQQLMWWLTCMRLVAVAVQGGETAALRRLKYYLWDSNLVAKYFDIRNGMLGGDYSTKVWAQPGFVMD
jgi:hypothetical protein